jgi:hypothetical protein
MGGCEFSVDSPQEYSMPPRSETDDERLLKSIEQQLGWSLAPEQQDEALRRHRQGESATAIATGFETLETARQALNDPDAPLRVPATRPADDDPRNFPGTVRKDR